MKQFDRNLSQQAPLIAKGSTFENALATKNSVIAAGGVANELPFNRTTKEGGGNR